MSCSGLYHRARSPDLHSRIGLGGDGVNSNCLQVYIAVDHRNQISCKNVGVKE